MNCAKIITTCKLVQILNMQRGALTTTKLRMFVPLTFSWAEYSELPTGFIARQVYVPLCWSLTFLRSSTLSCVSTLLIIYSDEETSSMPSLYHWRDIGSSPSLTAHDTWTSWPASTSSRKVKGRICGATDDAKWEGMTQYWST